MILYIIQYRIDKFREHDYKRSWRVPNYILRQFAMTSYQIFLIPDQTEVDCRHKDLDAAVTELKTAAGSGADERRHREFHLHGHFVLLNLLDPL